MDKKLEKIISVILFIIGGILLFFVSGIICKILAVVLVTLGVMTITGKVTTIFFSQKQITPVTTEDKYNIAIEKSQLGNAEEVIDLLKKILFEPLVGVNCEKFLFSAMRDLGTLYYKGVLNNTKIDPDYDRAIEYYQMYIERKSDSEVEAELSKIYLEQQNFPKAMTYLELAGKNGNNYALLKLGRMYEEGVNRLDSFGNKGEVVIPPDLEKAQYWYKMLSDRGDKQGKDALEQLEYKLSHNDSIEFEEKEKIYAKIYERRKAAGTSFVFRRQDATKFQYQYIYIHDQVDGFIHKMPKDWIKAADDEEEETYFAPKVDDMDFRVYVKYDSIPKESERPLDLFLRYENDVLEYEIAAKEYITEYADGICATFFRNEDEKTIISFAFEQQNRMACIRFVCSNPDILANYEEIIFEVANSFAFVDPTMVSDTSANRKENQYYSEAIFYYGLDQYALALEFAKKAQKVGSKKASYLIIELYYDEESPYKNYEKAVAAAEELFSQEEDADIAFLTGNIYEKLKYFERALEWYEKALALGHKRVPFYLGRLYYYGVLRIKRNGRKAHTYFKQAEENGVAEASAYLKDIDDLGYQDLQETIDKLEEEVKSGNSEKALKLAMMKKDQVFYIASDRDIENAFMDAFRLGNPQAAYELGLLYKSREKKKGFDGKIISNQYFEVAFDAGYADFDSEALCEVVELKKQKGLSLEAQRNLYLRAAMIGYIPAIDKVIELTKTLSDDIRALYEKFKKQCQKGDVNALKSMNRFEKAYPALVDLPPDVTQTKKVIQNKFFKLAVPKECIAVINNDGGTIKIADSIVDFAVAEMPVQADDEKNFVQVYNLIMKEYSENDNAEVRIVNSRLVGGSMLKAAGRDNSLSILLISSKNQYLFKLSSSNRTELYKYKSAVLDIAQTIVETGETYIATDDSRRRNIGIGFLLESNGQGTLQISKAAE